MERLKWGSFAPAVSNRHGKVKSGCTALIKLRWEEFPRKDFLILSPFELSPRIISVVALTHFRDCMYDFERGEFDVTKWEGLRILHKLHRNEYILGRAKRQVLDRGEERDDRKVRRDA